MYDYEIEEWTEKLVGKKIVGLAFATDKQKLRLKFADASALDLVTTADCCSNSWIEHISGVKQAIGHTVTAIENVPMPEDQWDKDECELTRFYGVKLRTDGGELFIEYRNSSNGYYGGDLEIEEPSKEDLPPLLVDVA